MKPGFLIAILFAACAAQTQTLRVVPVHLEGTGQTTKSVQFFCTQDYNRDECRQHALGLRRVLMTYPLDRLGMWSFVLVPSYKWKDLVRALGSCGLRFAVDDSRRESETSQSHRPSRLAIPLSRGARSSTPPVA